ncbi:M56 family metallopeptidase [Sessilibacter corallicola]|uniref:M56 family metallopeptidase n=1 Tax=Sessilibacter corallicola TaxID=2904075 RepID=UPI001E3A3DD6|nr:M56 family metallopeptidase [Sessilibacter corallicola]MCE2029680.1 M56 family metallopeptidase [Sessilibacter corallicola]
MEISEGAFVLNLFSIGLLSLLIATVLLSTASPLLNRSLALISASNKKKVLWAYVLSPWLIGLVSVGLVVLSERVSNSLIAQITHWHHLYVFDIASWHGATLILFIVITVYVIFSRAHSAVRQSHNLRVLDNFTESELNEHQTITSDLPSDVVLIDSRLPSAFSAGFFQAKCYLTTGLVDQVTTPELDIIIDHERSHNQNKDSLQKWIFRIFASLFPNNLAKQLNKNFSTSCELLADAEVAKSYCSFDIAQTLVNAARIQRVYFKTSNSLVSHFIDNDIDIRVRALVAPQVYRLYPLAFYGLAFVTVSVISFSVVDTLHHVVDTLFSH